MAVSSKCYYAIRAIYALAEHGPGEPMKIADIAEKEMIPIRFLEVILGQLKGGGFVQSRRGPRGIPPVQAPGRDHRRGDHAVCGWPIAPIDCVSQSRPKECEFHGECHFFGSGAAWRQAISGRGGPDHVRGPDPGKQGRQRGFVNEWMI